MCDEDEFYEDDEIDEEHVEAYQTDLPRINGKPPLTVFMLHNYDSKSKNEIAPSFLISRFFDIDANEKDAIQALEDILVQYDIDHSKSYNESERKARKYNSDLRIDRYNEFVERFNIPAFPKDVFTECEYICDFNKVVDDLYDNSKTKKGSYGFFVASGDENFLIKIDTENKSEQYSRFLFGNIFPYIFLTFSIDGNTAIKCYVNGTFGVAREEEKEYLCVSKCDSTFDMLCKGTKKKISIRSKK